MRRIITIVFFLSIATNIPAMPPAPKGILIFHGQWHPHYPFEHIAWVKPSWPSHQYIIMDFPEAIFVEGKLLYLSHVNPRWPVPYSDLPKVEWRTIPKGIAFDRILPNGIKFGGSLVENHDSTGVLLELYIDNGSTKPLKKIKLQTCAFLWNIKEFSEHTKANKFVHNAESGWLSLDAAEISDSNSGLFQIGCQAGDPPKGPQIADLPVIVAISNEAKRLAAFTGYNDTLAFWGNPNHPCFHADPFFPDIEPGQKAVIHGELLFFEGELQQFADFFKKRYEKNKHISVSK